jgi:hypothetical protein
MCCGPAHTRFGTRNIASSVAVIWSTYWGFAVRSVSSAAGRAIGIVAMTCVAFGVGVPAAQAVTVSYPDPTGAQDLEGPRILAYGADPGANSLGVAVSGASVEFSDPTALPVGAAELPADCPVAVPLTCSLERVVDLTIDLGDSNDTVAVGGAGPPTLVTTVNGGDGDDRADYSGRSGATIALNGTAADGVTFRNVEDATGSPARDTITGSDAANRLVGSGGNDDLNGGLGADTLLGGLAADALDGGDGDDVLVGGEGIDTFAGGEGADEILAADGVSETISCGPGEDSVAADFGPQGDTVTLDCETVTGLVDPQPDADPAPDPTPSSGPQQQPVTTAADTGLRAPVPVLADAVATPGDLTAPSARLRVAVRQRLANVLARGVLVPVGCSESCGISVAVLLDRTTARRLDLAGRAGPAVIGTATARLAAAGTKSVRVRLTQRARRALRSAKTVRVTVQGLVSDASGNGTLLQRRVTLRR